MSHQGICPGGAVLLGLTDYKLLIMCHLYQLIIYTLYVQNLCVDHPQKIKWKLIQEIYTALYIFYPQKIIFVSIQVLKVLSLNFAGIFSRSLSVCSVHVSHVFLYEQQSSGMQVAKCESVKPNASRYRWFLICIFKKIPRKITLSNRSEFNPKSIK